MSLKSRLARDSSLDTQLSPLEQGSFTNTGLFTPSPLKSRSNPTAGSPSMTENQHTALSIPKMPSDCI